MRIRPIAASYGGRHAGFVRAVCCREIEWVAGLAREVDAAVDRGGEDGALIGPADPRVAIASADIGFVAPAGCGQRREALAPVAAEQPHQFIDRELRGVAIFQHFRAVAAEEALDDRPAERRQAVAGGASAVRVADQVRVGRPFGPVDVEEHLVR
jgi:hypothetical protein